MADDLIKQAHVAGKAGTDLYALVGNVASDAPVEDVRRAWRRRNLKLHPDKAGDAFDPDLYGRFSEALAILENVDARAAYDSLIAAARAQQARHNEMDVDRRRMVEDLVAREKAAASGQPYSTAHSGAQSTKRHEPSRREAGEERRRREMREMKEHDRRRLDEEHEKLRQIDKDTRERMRREDDERAQWREQELERKIRDKQRRRDKRQDRQAERIGGKAKSGREAWRWTRVLLEMEQKLKEGSFIDLTGD